MKPGFVGVCGDVDVVQPIRHPARLQNEPAKRARQNGSAVDSDHGVEERARDRCKTDPGGDRLRHAMNW
jgi:hypothetical protein